MGYLLGTRTIIITICCSTLPMRNPSDELHGCKADVPFNL